MARCATLITALLLTLVAATGTASAIPFEYVPGTDMMVQYNGPAWTGRAVEDISHLQWLNVGRLTLGESFNSILKQTEPGGLYEGFRPPTTLEVLGLFHALGYQYFILQDPEIPDAILTFANMLNIPIQGPPLLAQAGAMYEYTRENWDISVRPPVFLGYYPDPYYANVMFLFGYYGANGVNHGGWNRNITGPLVGTLLVRNASPALPQVAVTPPPVPPAQPSLTVTIDPNTYLPGDRMFVTYRSSDALFVGAETLQVSILSTKRFDATTVDVKTLRFGHTGNEKSLISCGLKQVNKSKSYDLRCFFDTMTAGIFTGTGYRTLTLKGQTTKGVWFMGTGTIELVNR